MKVYKVNKKEMIGAVILSIVVLAVLGFMTYFAFQDEVAKSNLLFGTYMGFQLPILVGVTSINRKREPIERVEVEDRYIKEQNET